MENEVSIVRKRVGWVSYSMTGEINPNGGRSSGGLILRIAFLKFLIEQGYEIVWYSPMKKGSEEYLKGEYKKENPFMEHIIYNPEATKVDDGINTLFIENGPGNLLYSNKYHKMSSIGYCGNMLRQFSGTVFYFMVDILLPFPFNSEQYYESWMNTELQYGTPVDLVRNKRWVTLSTTPDVNKWYEKHKGNARSPMDQLKGIIPAIFVPYTDFTFDMVEPMPFNEEPEIELCMIGNERGNERVDSVVKYYDRPDAVIYGKWEEKSRSKFSHAQFRGPIDSDQVMKKYNNSKLHIVVADRNSLKHCLTHYPYRIVQAIQAGCPVLFQKGCVDLERVGLDKSWEIDDSNKDEHIARMLAMTTMERREFNQRQKDILIDHARVGRNKDILNEAIKEQIELGRKEDIRLVSKIIDLTEIETNKGLADSNEKRRIKAEGIINFRKKNYNEGFSVHGSFPVKLKIEEKEKGLKSYTSPRWTGEILDCAMPLTLDTYNKCSFNCLYCFSYFQKSHSMAEKNYQQRSGLGAVDVNTFERLMDLDPKLPDSYKQFFPYIEQRKVIQWGGLSDQFDKYEKQEGRTLQLLEIMKKHNYPLSFSTKSVWFTKDDRYMKLFEGQKNWHIKFSIICLNEKRARVMEKGVTTPLERLDAMERVGQISGGGTTLRLRPFIIGLTDKDNEHLELIELAKSKGAQSMSTEFFCLERRADDRLLNRYSEMSNILGFDVLEFYKKHSRGSGYSRLNYDIKTKFVYEMKHKCDEVGLRFFISDAHHKEKCETGGCCGLPDNDNYNWSKGQFTQALIIAKEKGTVCWADMEPHLEMFKKFEWAKAFGYNTMGATARAGRKNQTMYDYIREQWNTPNSAKSPYKYFSGVLYPEKLDESKNIIYSYRPKELFDVEGNKT